MVIAKTTRLDRVSSKLKLALCKRCGKKIIGNARIRGLSVICPRCKRPV
ncbi:hypothetical protein HN789_05805 [archaeon]|nr:hypothetical protein [archaeon]MBT4271755.1 hypothetical protein [archaeon]MBT4858655.1 hypothetical protein [archaeon]MBT6772857.1 hypothetical protein [archaeon]MBT7440733.1 hypothetical protein [archaeon]